jgi:WD40 repeat protein
VLLWSVEDGGSSVKLPVSVKGVYQLAFSGDGKWLALAAADGKVRVWQLP